MNLTRSILHILFFLSVFACAALSFSNPAQAAEKTLLGASQLAELFGKFIIADSPFPAEDLKIYSFTSRPKAIELPAGKVEYLFDMGPMTGRLGLRTFNLDVLVNGVKAANVKMSGTVQLYGNVLSAARTLKRGTLLSKKDLKKTRRNITMLGTDLVQDPALVIGKQLKTTLQPGRILFTSLLKKPEIIKRGDMVTIQAKSKQIQVSVPGKARSAGARGDTIKVKNLMSRKEVYAKIINQNEVQVDF